MPRQLTMQELIEMTTIKHCANCGLRHAAVRTCEDARLQHRLDQFSDEVYRDGKVLPYGRCDTCGEPCDEGGCTLDHDHETAKPN